MYIITPSPIPNQQFDTFVEGIRYFIRLHLFRDMLYADVTYQYDEVARSVRCIDRTWLFPVHIHGMPGNMRFESATKGEYPDYEKFGTKCNLVYYSNEEIAEMEAEGNG